MNMSTEKKYSYDDLDKKYDNLDKEYKKRFGYYYPVAFGDFRPTEEHIRIMEECLETGIPVDPKSLKNLEGVITDDYLKIIK